MAITTTCPCGKKLTVGDALAGRSLKCPKCGNPVPIGAVPIAADSSSKKTVNPKVTISPGTILYLVIGAVLLIASLTLYFGPMRVRSAWETLAPKAEDEVRTVLDFGLQAYLSERGEYNPTKTHATPSVQGDITFSNPFFAMSMPEKIKFFGKSNQGDYSGYYHSRTGEVEANLEYGGQAFAGMVNISKAAGKFSLTGRLKDKQPQAENEGRPLKIIYRKSSED